MTRKKNDPDFSGNLLNKLFGDFSSLLRSYHGYDANSVVQMLIILKVIHGKFLGLFFRESDWTIKFSIRHLILVPRFLNEF